ncbi:Uncharacterized membrane protein YcaP, DUF421 family [Mesobacillus persicus]|uniref:Uncharacterized membrane protein YcaP, DUF421 family n=1 Tax=Mesobacillus persicus TaxID=930146 RepID=A0A1H7WIN0_9BACI|nr:DUF421 domain-containing protein [Mesobacillus persicus]SEM21204.1 Uncharacterized membrane protein YcaP, DUF421 family [Mesobacillus persicus]
MDLHIIWKAMLMVTLGFLFLRFVGRKSVAQMTIATTVVLISVGSIIIQPVINHGIINTIGATAIFILFLMVVEFLTMKFNGLEKLITGKSKVVIQNGQLQTNTLKKLRLTVDKLEMQLRQQGVKQISDVKTATVEPNGQVGFELVPDAQPLTVGEFKKLMKQLGHTFPAKEETNNSNTDLFEEILQPTTPPNRDQLH